MGMLKVAKAKGTILQELKKIERLDMLILDDFGIQPFDSQGRMNLMDIIEDRHGKKSTVITSQVPVRDWYDVIGVLKVPNLVGATYDEAVKRLARLKEKEGFTYTIGETQKKNNVKVKKNRYIYKRNLM